MPLAAPRHVQPLLDGLLDQVCVEAEQRVVVGRGAVGRVEALFVELQVVRVRALGGVLLVHGGVELDTAVGSNARQRPR